MNTLTPNRILEKGDQYRDNGAWKPVLPADYGLQICFTKYTEVRRPSETPSKNLTISPDGGERPTAKAEKEKTPVPTPSGTGDTPNRHRDAKAAYEYLKKLHPLPSSLRETPVTAKDAPTEPAKSPVSPALYDHEGKAPFPPNPDFKDPALDAMEAEEAELKKGVATVTLVPTLTSIAWNDKDNPNCIWIGRNGTYKCRGVNLEVVGDVIQVLPVGKRGEAKNALIEFPCSAIPQVIDFLLRHQKP